MIEYHTTRTDEVLPLDDEMIIRMTISNWRQMRQYAIEIGVMAERQLISLGQMTETERQIFTRKERRGNAL